MLIKCSPHLLPSSLFVFLLFLASVLLCLSVCLLRVPRATASLPRAEAPLPQAARSRGVALQEIPKGVICVWGSFLDKVSLQSHLYSIPGTLPYHPSNPRALKPTQE